jgi:hypothetical protein
MKSDKAELLAFARALKAKQQQGEAVVATEVLPPPAPQGEWSASDPSCLVRLIDAAIRAEGDVDHAARVMGCPADVALALQADPAWDQTWDRRCHVLITQKQKVRGLKAVAEKVASEGNAYGLRVLADIAPKDDLTDDEKARITSLRSLTPSELVKEIDRRLTVLMGFRNRLTAGKAPAPESVAGLVSSLIGPLAAPQRGESAAPLDAPVEAS